MTKKSFLMCMAILLSIHSSAAAKAPDYSKTSSWCQILAITKDVDTFYILATEYMGFNEGDPDYATVDNAEMVESAPVQYSMNASAFAESTNVFMSFYRQAALKYAGEIYKRDGNIDAAIFGMPYNDIAAALDYCFKHYNNGRPFVLASHSQGSAIANLVLKKYFKEHPEYFDAPYPRPELIFASLADETEIFYSTNIFLSLVRRPIKKFFAL